ncbi:MAG: hypothetical protein WCO56_06400 [Verrucomicrobiota bacterium]
MQNITQAAGWRRIIPVPACLLDHDGCPTGKSLAVTEGRFTVDGARDQTPYYEVTVE